MFNGMYIAFSAVDLLYTGPDLVSQTQRISRLELAKDGCISILYER
jgi:hypothetical protein